LTVAGGHVVGCGKQQQQRRPHNIDDRLYRDGTNRADARCEMKINPDHRIRLGLGEVPIPRVDGFEFAALDRNARSLNS
jgi:hypothetical protein